MRNTLKVMLLAGAFMLANADEASAQFRTRGTGIRLSNGTGVNFGQSGYRTTSYGYGGNNQYSTFNSYPYSTGYNQTYFQTPFSSQYSNQFSNQNYNRSYYQTPFYNSSPTYYYPSNGSVGIYYRLIR